MATYLITGGAGFIGANLTQAVLQRGEKARVLDNLSTGKLPNLEGLKGDIEFIEGDICDLDAVKKAAKGVDYVLHQAALPSVPRAIKDPIASNRVNVEGTLNVLIAARDAQVKKFVMASSSSVYGNTPKMPKEEIMMPAPMSPYATAKLAAERYAMNFANLYGLPTIALRYFNVFGPKQDPNSQYSAVIPIFIKALLYHRPLVIHGDGDQSRDFTFVENVVEGNLKACEAEVKGEFMNMACGSRYTLNEMVALLEKYTGKKANKIFQDSRPGDVKHSHASIEKASRLINFQPKISFEEGLRKTVAWYTKTLTIGDEITA